MIKLTAEQEALEKGLSDGTGWGADEPIAKKAAEPAAGAKAAGDGESDGAGKSVGDDGAKKPAEDPEIDLSKYGLGKVKKSELEAWKKSQMLETDYRQKTENLKSQETQLKELFELSDYLSKHPTKLKKVLAILDEVEGAAEGVKDGTLTPKEADKETKDAQATIAEVLKNLDPDDPAAAILKAMY